MRYGRNEDPISAYTRITTAMDRCDAIIDIININRTEDILRKKARPQIVASKRNFPKFEEYKPKSDRKRGLNDNNDIDGPPKKKYRTDYNRPCHFGSLCTRRNCKYKHGNNNTRNKPKPNTRNRPKRQPICRFHPHCKYGNKCHYFHPKNNNNTNNRFGKKPKNGRTNNCYRCGRPGHIAINCSQPWHIKGYKLTDHTPPSQKPSFPHYNPPLANNLNNEQQTRNKNRNKSNFTLESLGQLVKKHETDMNTMLTLMKSIKQQKQCPRNNRQFE
eukprot:47716_1